MRQVEGQHRQHQLLHIAGKTEVVQVSAIQTGQQFGMQTLDQNLQDLVRRNIVSSAEARTKAANKDNFVG